MGAVAKKTGSTEVAFYEYGDDAGAGFENQTGADYSIPFIAVLQQMSPQCGDPRDGGTEGAKPGMLFNTVTGEIWDGREGVEFVPGTTEHVFVEWVPREKGGGMVTRHAVDSDVVRNARARGGDFGKLKTSAGNDLIETFYVYGVICANGEPSERVVLAFTSTKIKIYKHWNTKVGFFMVPTKNGKARPPLFSHLVKITSTKEKNNKGEFYNFTLSPANGDVAKSLLRPDDSRYLAGKEVRDAVLAGQAQANYASQEAAGRDGDNSDKAPF
jgi:hypothetical protein